jgi:hypothetical protein
MVRPASFAGNPQTAPSNAFQTANDGTVDAQRLALQEFDALVRQLEVAGVAVIVGADSASPSKPDAIFPNNWVSFHADGTLVLYPMLAENRRLERRADLIEQVLEQGYRASRTIDLSRRELSGQFLEGTGSLVLDRTQHIAYACRSPRTDASVLEEFGRLLDYEIVAFDARDARGLPVYHTNVLMAVADGFAVLCSATIVAAAQRAAVLERLSSGGREIIDISLEQMTSFAGNLLALAPPGGPLIALSCGALNSLSAAQRQALERHGRILAAEIPTIERFGGGGVRCMLCEIHLPKSPSG